MNRAIISCRELICRMACEAKGMQSVIVEACQHKRVHEIGQDFDEDGRLLRLVRCQKCGLLTREYLPRIGVPGCAPLPCAITSGVPRIACVTSSDFAFGLREG